jgi:5-methylcytosine-specific restriction endonuclease McrA
MGAESKWHSWYNQVNWLRRRAHQLRVEPLCRLCAQEGRLTPATVVDHVTPHKGDYNMFRLGKLQSLCARCHSSTKAIAEKRGYDPAIGADGWPLDRRHPVYRNS